MVTLTVVGSALSVRCRGYIFRTSRSTRNSDSAAAGLQPSRAPIIQGNGSFHTRCHVQGFQESCRDNFQYLLMSQRPPPEPPTNTFPHASAAIAFGLV